MVEGNDNGNRVSFTTKELLAEIHGELAKLNKRFEGHDSRIVTLEKEVNADKEIKKYRGLLAATVIALAMLAIAVVGLLVQVI